MNSVYNYYFFVVLSAILIPSRCLKTCRYSYVSGGIRVTTTKYCLNTETCCGDDCCKMAFAASALYNLWYFWLSLFFLLMLIGVFVYGCYRRSRYRTRQVHVGAFIHAPQHRNAGVATVQTVTTQHYLNSTIGQPPPYGYMAQPPSYSVAVGESTLTPVGGSSMGIGVSPMMPAYPVSPYAGTHKAGHNLGQLMRLPNGPPQPTAPSIIHSVDPSVQHY